MDGAGEYFLDDEGRFGPYELAWEYTAENKKDFYSGFISGATRLPNGNTFICEGATGRFFEVNPDGKTLWEHVNTFGGELDMEGRPNDAEEEARKLLREVVSDRLSRTTPCFAPRSTSLTTQDLPAERCNRSPNSPFRLRLWSSRPW